MSTPNHGQHFNYLNKTTLPILNKLKDVYKIWHKSLENFPRHTRHTVGKKIDLLFLESIELPIYAIYQNRDEKYANIQNLNNKLDVIRFLLKILWEMKTLNNKKYLEVSNKVFEIGKMAGGWLKSTKNSLNKGEKRNLQTTKNL